MNNNVSITLIKSLIGRKKKHIHIANQLGLRKMHAEVTHKDTPAIRGLINAINYMVLVEEKP